MFSGATLAQSAPKEEIEKNPMAVRNRGELFIRWKVVGCAKTHDHKRAIAWKSAISEATASPGAGPRSEEKTTTRTNDKVALEPYPFLQRLL